jgi:hypothetical protein
MSHQHGKVVRHVFGAGLVLAAGLVLGALSPDRARSQSGCGLTQCMMSGGGCEFTYNTWYCNDTGSGCTTEQCGPGGRCELECQT